MRNSLISGFGLAVIAVALTTGLRGDEPVAPPSSSVEQVAYSAIFPAFVPHGMPVPDMVDIVVEGALQHPATPASPHQPPVTPSGNPAEQRPSTTPRRTHPAKVSVRSVSAPYSTNRASLIKVSAVHDELQNFSTLLRPGGFQRPLWQDMEISAELGTRDTEMEPFIVMIDPGHGGTDHGATGHNGLLEKDLTLDIARRVRLFLTEFEHFDVRLTRHHDYGLSRQSRVNSIQKSKADMVISLHFNHLPQSDVNLVESYYAGPANIAQSLSAQRAALAGELKHTGRIPAVDLSFTEGSSRLANALHRRVFNEVSFSDANAQNAGVKQETLFVLTQSFTPGVLLEISCLSHAGEANRLESEDYRNRLAAALVDGIRDYHDALQREPLRKGGDLGA